jgi:hypothetical protein
VIATVKTRRPLDITERRDSLLALIKHTRLLPITTSRAQALYAATPWSGIGRNATRRDLRDLARRGHLLPIGAENQRAYLPNPSTMHRHPVGVPRMERALLQAIASEGGEWTPGRAKVVLHRAAGTHIYRSVARRFLEDLHRAGLVELHSERPGHCYYTSLIEGGAA